MQKWGVLLGVMLFFSSAAQASDARYSVQILGNRIFASSDSGVYVYDLSSYQQAGFIRTGAPVASLAQAEGKIYAGTKDGKILALDPGGRILRQATIDEGSSVGSLAYSGAFLYAGTDKCTVIKLDMDLKVVRRTGLCNGTIITAIAAGSDRVYAGDMYGLITEMDDSLDVINRGSTLAFGDRVGNGVWDLKLHGGKLYSAHVKQDIIVWDAGNLSRIMEISGFDRDVMSIAVDDKAIFAGIADGTVIAMDSHGNRTREAKSHLASVLDLVAKGDNLYSASSDGSVIVWDKNLSVKKILGKQSVPAPRIAEKKIAFNPNYIVGAGCMLLVLGYFYYEYHRERRKSTFLRYLAKTFSYRDILVISLLVTGIIVVVGVINPQQVFPKLSAGQSGYFDVLVRSSPLRILWFILLPLLGFGAGRKIRDTFPFKAAGFLVMLAISIIAYLIL